MSVRRLLFLAVSLLVSFSLLGQQQYTITPDHGPTAGGTQVTVKGNFGSWPYGLIFGSVHVPATRVDETTLVATTPPHFPGEVDVTVFEYDIGVSTDLKFRFEGEVEDAFERLLLPVFIPPIEGAFGSRFETDLNAALADGERVELYGVRLPCRIAAPCLFNDDDAMILTPASPALGEHDPSGTPGAFLYVPKNQVKNLSVNLRAYDTSRSATSFGTEIPIVPSGEFFENWETITIVGVPSDPRFRNTLRIYSAGAQPHEATLRVSRNGVVLRESTIILPAQPDAFHPGYLEIGGLPQDGGTLRIDILVPNPPFLPVSRPPDRWAFVSVTNNETQHITTLTPRP